MAKNVQEALDEAGNIVDFLRNSQAGLFAFPVVAHEVTSWRLEQQAWRETVGLLDQSFHMANMLVKGPDAIKMLNYLGVNSFSGFQPGKAKQFVCVNYDGHYIGDVVLFFNRQDELELVGRPPAMNWVQFHAASGKWDVTIKRRDRSPLQTGGATIERDYYRFQIQGPNVPVLFERLNGGPLPEIKFFNFAEINMGAHKAFALRHSMSGVAGYEVWGPYADYNSVIAAVQAAGKDLGLRLVGSRAYGTSSIDSAWIPSPVSAVYTGETMRSYREWLPAVGYETMNAIGGSFVSDKIEDYYVTPYDLGYGHVVKFDHDFIGRDALEALKDMPHRRKVTYVWNHEDVAAITQSQFGLSDQLPFKAIEFPFANYTASPHDRVMKGDQVVGFGMWTSYSYNERAVLTVGLVDAEVQNGEELTLIWGEEDGGTRKVTVEPHRQYSVRVTVADAPYSRDAAHIRIDSFFKKSA